MSTFTCDIDESGTAQSSVKLGFTDILVEVGACITRVALASAATFLTTAAAASSVDIEHGPFISERGTAVSLLAATANTTTIVQSRGEAESFIDRESGVTALAQGAGQSAVELVRTLTAEALGNSQSFVLPSGLRTIMLADSAVGRSSLFGFNDFTYITSGAGQSHALPSTAAMLVLTSQGSGSSAVVLSNGPDEVVQSVAEAFSAVVQQARLTSTVESTASGMSAVLVPRKFSAWVMNTESTAMTRYEDVPVQSMAVIGGKILGLGEGGLYEMKGTSDDGSPIASRIRTGKSMLGYEALKNLGDIVISYVCAGVMQVRIGCYGGPVEGSYTYSMPVREAKSPRGNRLVPGKGMRSRYYEFEFYSNSAAFGVDTVTADVAVNVRRV